MGAMWSDTVTEISVKANNSMAVTAPQTVNLTWRKPLKEKPLDCECLCKISRQFIQWSVPVTQQCLSRISRPFIQWLWSNFSLDQSSGQSHKQIHITSHRITMLKVTLLNVVAVSHRFCIFRSMISLSVCQYSHEVLPLQTPSPNKWRCLA